MIRQKMGAIPNAQGNITPFSFGLLAKIVKEEKEERDKQEVYRKSLFEYLKFTFTQYNWGNWHHSLICEYLQGAIFRKYKRLMVFTPPRHMKSESLERAFAWALGRFMNLKFMICSYGTPKSRKLSKHIKQNVKSELHRKVFCDFKNEDLFSKDYSDTQDYWELGAGYRGSLLAAGVRAAITGEGFDIAAIDDPVKSREEAESATYQDATWEWYQGTFLNRQDAENSSIIIMNTRWHTQDLCGKLLATEGIRSYNGRKPEKGCPEWNEDPNGKWDVLNLVAIHDEETIFWKHPKDFRRIGEALWPQRFPVSFLDQFKRHKYNWHSLYQGSPVGREGNVLNFDWFNLSDINFNDSEIKYYRFWDLSGTPKEAAKQNDPDWTAGALCCFFEDNYYILDIQSIRDTPARIEKLILQTAQEDAKKYKNITQVWEKEGGASASHLEQYYLNLLSFTKRFAFKTNKNKLFYIDLLGNKAQTGNVFYKTGSWLFKKHDGKYFNDEVNEFPKSRHDDRLDAVSKCVFILAEEQRKGDWRQGLSLLEKYNR